jgi:hypothetical protein
VLERGERGFQASAPLLGIFGKRKNEKNKGNISNINKKKKIIFKKCYSSILLGPITLGQTVKVLLKSLNVSIYGNFLLGEAGFDSWQRQKDFLLSTGSRLALGPHTAS